MRNFSFKYNVSFLIAVTVCFTFSAQSSAQDGQPLYFHTTSRIVSPENNEAFLANMRDIIKPLYAAEVEAGRLAGWWLWRTRYKSVESEFNYIVSRASFDLADLEVAFEGGMETAASRALPNMRWSDINERLQDTSTVTNTELWVQSTNSVFRSGPTARWSGMSYYRNHSRFDRARELLLNEVVVPFQQGRIDRGISAGYGYYVRRFPFDDENSYNVLEQTSYDDFDQVLGANIGNQIWENVRKDNSTLNENMSLLATTRDLIKRELWELVDSIDMEQ